MTLRHASLRTSLLSMSASVALVAIGVGCQQGDAPSADTQDLTQLHDPPPAGELCASLDQIQTTGFDWAYASTEVTYGSTGVTANIQPIAVGTTFPIETMPFNGFDYGLSVHAMVGPTVSVDNPLFNVSPTYIEACSGTVRILPNAKINIAAGADTAAVCEPDSLAADGLSCRLKVGAKLSVSARGLRQRRGFVSPKHGTSLYEKQDNQVVIATIPVHAAIRLTGHVDDHVASAEYEGRAGWIDMNQVEPMMAEAVAARDTVGRVGAASKLAPTETLPKGTVLGIGGFAEGDFMQVYYRRPSDGEVASVYVPGEDIASPVYTPSWTF